jgi:phospholipase D1/2
VPSETADQDAPGHDTVAETEEPHEETNAGDKGAVADRHEDASTENGRTTSAGHGGSDPEASKRRPARGDEPFEKWEREAMEKLLGEVRGHLGAYVAYGSFVA